MKNVFEIYLKDLKRISRSYSAIIVIVALCILPSLYAWFNIKASWDPYSEKSTQGIKIGVVNKDIGTKIKDKEINIGNQVIEQLKNNHQMGWQFVDEKTANKQLDFGNYYANIIIPENFSKDISSFISDNIKKPEIVYNVNEKINAIAPKITDKGATGIQQNVNSAIRKTISDVVLSLGKDIGVEIKNQSNKIQEFYDKLVYIKNKIGDINKILLVAENGSASLENVLVEIKNNFPVITNELQKSKDLSTQINTFLNDFNNVFKNIVPTIKQDIKVISEFSLNISNDVKYLVKLINEGSNKAPEVINNLIAKTQNVNDMIESLIKLLKPLNNINPNKPFTEIIQKLESSLTVLNSILDVLNKIKVDIDNGYKPDTSKLENIAKLCDEFYNITNTIYNNFDEKITNPINQMIDKGILISSDVYKILDNIQNKIPELQKVMDNFDVVLSNGEQALQKIKIYLPKIEEKINHFITNLDNFDMQEFDKILNLLIDNINNRSDFLDNPINIIENKIYPIKNYGTGMTPFYTVLALWVGILLIVSILSINCNEQYKSYEVYFGKLLLFLSITIIQSLIVSLGDIYILKIYCDNPLIFILGNVLTSITFTFIVYSLVSVFGNIGKVIAIILLVLQVAGSGGTFPIQLTPKFFQVINPYLPFTYAISFNREAIGGVVKEVLNRDIVILLFYIILSIILGVLLKKPINKFLKGFTENFENSGIAE